MSDRDMWLIIRRALLMIVHAIERRYLKDSVYDICVGDKINTLD